MEDKPEKKNMSELRRLSIVVVTILAWLGLFVLGGNRPSAQVLALMEEASILELLWLTPKAIILWGWSNIAILTVLASMSGEAGRSASPNLAGGAARGFFVFLLAIGGQLIYIWGHADPAFHFPDQQTYFRLAGLASFVAFVVGWRPEAVSSLAARIGQQIHTDVAAPNSSDPPAPAKEAADD